MTIDFFVCCTDTSVCRPSMLPPHADRVTGLHWRTTHPACPCPRGHTAMGSCVSNLARYDGERNAQGQKHGHVRAYQMQLLLDWHTRALGWPPKFHLHGRPAILGRAAGPCRACFVAALLRPMFWHGLPCCARVAGGS